MLAGFVRSPNSVRTLVIVALLSTPLLTLWNLTTASPHAKITFGQPLRGVTAYEPLYLSLRAFADGSLQTALAAAVSEALPARPLLIRLSNSFRKRLFGLYGAPGVIAGDDGELIEMNYLREYCSRDLHGLRAYAAVWLPELRALQDYYDVKGKAFMYLRTPSKAAYMPEKFVGYYDCQSSNYDRRNYLPVYGELLAKAGIRTVDGAAMTHSMRGRFDVELFPQGGVHWNQLAVAHAADAILEQINRLMGASAAPRMNWTYTVTDRPSGTDTDLIDVANVMFGRPRFPVPKLTFEPGRPCSEWRASNIRIVIVGGSFVHDLARMLIEHGCLHGLLTYNYLEGAVQGGPGYARVRRNSSPEELRLLREADILILEENEGDLPGMRHSRLLADVVLGE